MRRCLCVKWEDPVCPFLFVCSVIVIMWKFTVIVVREDLVKVILYSKIIMGVLGCSIYVSHGVSGWFSDVLFFPVLRKSYVQFVYLVLSLTRGRGSVGLKHGYSRLKLCHLCQLRGVCMILRCSLGSSFAGGLISVCPLCQLFAWWGRGRIPKKWICAV